MAEAILFLGIIAFKMQVVTKVNWNQVGWSKAKLYWVRIELRSDGVAVRADVTSWVSNIESDNPQNVGLED